MSKILFPNKKQVVAMAIVFVLLISMMLTPFQVYGQADHKIGVPSSKSKERYEKAHRDPAERGYYESGDPEVSDPKNPNRGPTSEKAAKYNPTKTPPYDDDYPRKPDKTIDHAKVVENARKWVRDTLIPKGDPSGHSDGPDDVFDRFQMTPPQMEPGKPFDPNGAQRGGWVCIDRVNTLAAILRELGYPVRELNVVASTGLHTEYAYVETYFYQDAALEVWYDGAWHFVDPYKGKSHPREYLCMTWHGFHVTDYRVHYATKAGMDLGRRKAEPGKGRAPGWGKYDPITGKPTSNSGWKLHKSYDYKKCPYPRTLQFADITEAHENAYVYIIDSWGRITGFIPYGNLTEIPNVFFTNQSTPIYFTTDNDVPMGYSPENIIIVLEEAGSFDYTLVVWGPEYQYYDLGFGSVEVDRELQLDVGAPVDTGTEVYFDITVRVGDLIPTLPPIASTCSLDIGQEIRFDVIWPPWWSILFGPPVPLEINMSLYVSTTLWKEYGPITLPPYSGTFLTLQTNETWASGLYDWVAEELSETYRSIQGQLYILYIPTPPSVGGIWVPLDKLGLLAPYIALASTILVATAATAIYVKSVKRRKKKQ